MDSNRKDEHLELYRRLGEVIRDRRKELDMSQEQLAQVSNVDRAFISNIERGSRKPSFGTIASIAKGLKIRYSRLLARCEKLTVKSAQSSTNNVVPFDEQIESA